MRSKGLVKFGTDGRYFTIESKTRRMAMSLTEAQELKDSMAKAIEMYREHLLAQGVRV